MNREGRFFAVGFGGYEVLVFDAAGKHVSTFGERGEGPGEFRRPITDVKVLAGDSILVIEGVGRASVFDAAFAFVRAFNHPTGTYYGGTPLSGSRLLLNMTPRSSGGSVLSLHVVSPSGELLSSFGARGPAESHQATIALARDSSTIWASRFSTRGNGYRIERRSLDGDLLGTVTVPDSPWFSGTSDPNALPSHLQVWREDQDGRLWVRVIVGDPRGARETAPATRAGPRIIGVADLPTAESRHRAVDTVIEVLDPSSGQVLASYRSDLFLEPVDGVPSDLLWSRHQDEFGIISVKVWRVSAFTPA